MTHNKVERSINDNYHFMRLSCEVRLRQEYFGGLVYDTRNGNTLEVDRQAFQLLQLVRDRPASMGGILSTHHDNREMVSGSSSVRAVIHRLVNLKILEGSTEASLLPSKASSMPLPSQRNPWLSAPETVHWAVTYRCGQKCPDCYTSRFPPIKSEMTTYEALTVIDKIARWQVFQLALGGGEPFVREDLSQLVKHSADQGLSVHITTGRLDIPPDILEKILLAVKNLQIGVRNDHLLHTNSGKYLNRLQNVFGQMQKMGIIPGANVILTRSAIQRLEFIVKSLSNIGFERIVFLRYKPPQNIHRWKAELPMPSQMRGLHHNLNKMIKDHPNLNVRVDCALSFVQRLLPEQTAMQYGIKGCVAADRILALAPDGSVYPCSQLVSPRFYAGSLLESDPEIIWSKSNILRKYRSFRTKKVYRESWCGVCCAKSSCGGCRVFAMDGLGGDPGCPDPLRPSLTQLGKSGRRLDLLEYLKKYSVISVGEYMERYEVGQKTAIKELRACAHASSDLARSGRKKTARCQYVEDDIIRDVQHSVGATSGSVPFASYEDIARWMEAEYPENYPPWIRQGES